MSKLQSSSIVCRNEPLSKHCTLKIGGPANYYAEPSSEEEIADLLSFAKSNLLPFVVIGRGSNILFDDLGYRGIIIKLGENFSSCKIEKNTIIVQSGAWMPCVARLAQLHGLSGIEHTVGIPGNVGGMVTMNGGSQRKYIGERIISARVMLPDGSIETLSPVECGFGYRQSIFQKEAIIVLGVTICCEKSDPKVIRKEMLAILRERRSKFPRKEPNCGSVFKSEPEIYEKYGAPGKVIEALGFKGKAVGGIVVSERHANFFVNRGNGRAEEFLELVDLVESAVYQLSNVHMSKEIEYVKNPS